MFYEFAVDPKLIALWCGRERYMDLLNIFGVDAKRIPSQFPKNWWKQVEESFLSDFPNPTKRQIICKEVTREFLKKRKVKRGSKNYTLESSWVVNAEREHTIRPFQGILVKNNFHNSPSLTVLTSSEDILDLPKLANSCIVSRTPEELVKPIVPLLRCCEYAVFIDPYFDISPRFLEPFERALRILVNERYGNASPKVQLHTSTERFFNGVRSLEEDKKKAANLLDKFRNQLPNIIPFELEVRVVVWKERLRGQKLHNRYLLTDIGSVIYGTGLDCNAESFHQELQQGQTDTISCLSEENHVTIWCEYMETFKENLAFDKVDEINVKGIA
jgi:hypothetical protein